MQRTTLLCLLALLVVGGQLPHPARVSGARASCCAPMSCCGADRPCTGSGECPMARRAAADRAAEKTGAPPAPRLTPWHCGDEAPRVTPAPTDPWVPAAAGPRAVVRSLIDDAPFALAPAPPEPPPRG